jgi:hypothetical protein
VRYLLLALALAGCPPAGNGPTPTPIGTFGHCSSAAVRNTAEGILGDVVTALATGDYVAALAKLGAKFGAAEVGCAVDLAIAEFSAKAQRSPDAQTRLILDRAHAWRGANP